MRDATGANMFFHVFGKRRWKSHLAPDVIGRAVVSVYFLGLNIIGAFRKVHGNVKYDVVSILVYMIAVSGIHGGFVRLRKQIVKAS